MIFAILAIFIPLVLIDIFTPFALRKTTVFGISIPEPFIDNPQLTKFKKKYAVLIACIQIPFIAILFLIAVPLNEMMQSIIMIGGLLLYLLITMVIYLKLHYEVKEYKVQQQWDDQVTVVRVSSFETKFDKKDHIFPHKYFIPPFFITIGLTVWLIFLYPALPEKIPTHWGINGQPDAWSDKSLFSVFFLAFTLLFTQFLMYGLSYGIFNSAIQVKAQDSALSLQREHEMRKLSSEMMAFINLITTLFLGFISIQSFWSIVYDDMTLSMTYAMPLFIVLVFAGIYYYMKRSKALNAQFKELGNLESSPGDDDHWKWGIFYYNKSNPDLFIEKKFGVGWTVNFARPGVWIFLVLIIVLPLLPMFFM